MDIFPRVLLYIDNSNIYINTQEFSSLKKKYLGGVKDTCCRIDVGRLLTLACNGRELMHGKLYGSEPPALDTVWRAIRMRKIEVHHSERSSWNAREKQTDTKLVASAIEDIIILRQRAGNDRTIILFTGDKDMLPVVQAAIKYGWKVEIWSYKSSISNQLEMERDQCNNVKIIYIDDIFEKITFDEYIWGGDVPKERSIVIRFNTRIPHQDLKKTTQELVKHCSSLFNLPFMVKYLDSVETVLVLIPCMREKIKKSPEEFENLYDFNTHIWSRIKELKEHVDNCDILPYMQYLQLKQGLTEENSDSDDKSEANVDLYDLALAEGGNFTTVISKKTKPSRLYSKACQHGYACQHGQKCHYSHRDTEKEFFKEHPFLRRRLYKSKLCTARPCKYRDKTYLCPYAHELIEARCLRCKKVGVHWTDECELIKV